MFSQIPCLTLSVNTRPGVAEFSVVHSEHGCHKSTGLRGCGLTYVVICFSVSKG